MSDKFTCSCTRGWCAAPPKYKYVVVNPTPGGAAKPTLADALPPPTKAASFVLVELEKDFPKVHAKRAAQLLSWSQKACSHFSFGELLHNLAMSDEVQ